MDDRFLQRQFLDLCDVVCPSIQAWIAATFCPNVIRTIPCVSFPAHCDWGNDMVGLRSRIFFNIVMFVRSYDPSGPEISFEILCKQKPLKTVSSLPIKFINRGSPFIFPGVQGSDSSSRLSTRTSHAITHSPLLGPTYRH